MKATRTYRMKRRAESQAETRQRIVDAAVQLHEARGVSATTISEIAERAGVERLTVYRHFPDEVSLVRACSSHWYEKNPLPDRTRWSGIADPAAKTRLALASFYAYYRRTEGMWDSILKEAPDSPGIKSGMKHAQQYLNAFVKDLAEAWNLQANKHDLLPAALHHSVQFYTWQSLKRQNMTDKKIVELMILWFIAIRNTESACFRH